MHRAPQPFHQRRIVGGLPILLEIRLAKRLPGEYLRGLDRPHAVPVQGGLPPPLGIGGLQGVMHGYGGHGGTPPAGALPPPPPPRPPPPRAGAPQHPPPRTPQA